VTPHHSSNQEQVRKLRNLSFVVLHFALKNEQMIRKPSKERVSSWTHFECYQANNNTKREEDEGNDQPQEAPDYNSVSPINCLCRKP